MLAALYLDKWSWQTGIIDMQTQKPFYLRGRNLASLPSGQCSGSTTAAQHGGPWRAVDDDNDDDNDNDDGGRAQMALIKGLTNSAGALPRLSSRWSSSL